MLSELLGILTAFGALGGSVYGIIKHHERDGLSRANHAQLQRLCSHDHHGHIRIAYRPWKKGWRREVWRCCCGCGKPIFKERQSKRIG